MEGRKEGRKENAQKVFTNPKDVCKHGKTHGDTPAVHSPRMYQTVFRPAPGDGRSHGPKPYTTSARHFFVQRLAGQGVRREPPTRRANATARDCMPEGWPRDARRGCRSRSTLRQGTHPQRGRPTCQPQGINKKEPLEVFLKGLMNPAATYSPGPEGQVPSAIGGLTSVFGMGTGVTLPRLPLKQCHKWRPKGNTKW